MKIALVYPDDGAYGFSSPCRWLAEALHDLPDTEVETFPLMLGRQPTSYYIELGEKLNAPNIDVIHLPHEYSFYGGVLPKESGFWELRYLLKKPVVLTAYNIAPMETLLADANITLPQRLANALHFRSKATRDAIEIAPFATAYTIVSTNYERGILIERGAKPEYVTVIPDGIPKSSDIEMISKTVKLGYRGRTPKDSQDDADVPETKKQRYQTGAGLVMGGFSWEDRIALTYALSSGCVILIARTPETQEISNRLDCLELYDPEDDAHFDQTWSEFSNNQERRSVLSKQARRYAERYSFPRVAVSTRRAYAAAISVF